MSAFVVFGRKQKRKYENLVGFTCSLHTYKLYLTASIGFCSPLSLKISVVFRSFDRDWSFTRPFEFEQFGYFWRFDREKMFLRSLELENFGAF